MNRQTLSFITRATLCFFFVAALSACHHAEKHDHEEENEEQHEKHSPDEIILEPEQAKSAGVETQTVVRSTFNDVIKVSGSIVAASCDETTIVAPVDGVVNHTRHISEGIAISQGSNLYRISSDKLQEGDYVQRTKINYLAAKREYDRAQPLVKDKIISEKEFNAIRSEYETAQLAYNAIDKNPSDNSVMVKSPITGYMKQCLVKDGDYVSVGTPLMIVTKNQHLYLRAEVPVRHYDVLSKITTAKFRTQYSNDVIDLKTLNGTLLSSGKSAVTSSSYIPITFQIDNKGSLVAGSYAEIFLVTGQRSDIVNVPTSSLTEEQGLYYVYLKTGDHTYRKQEVTLGATDGEFSEITSGLKGGEQVVTKGAMAVKLASAANTIPSHSHNH